MSSKIYPLQFKPILKERIWGGTKLKTVLDKPIVSAITGESWEISTVEGDISVVANGVLTGESLNDLINQNPEAFLGIAVYKKFGKQFPLLFKYLDAREDLSIQLHPNDELAKKHHNSFGKTEMWYVMQADQESKIIVGFKEKSSPTHFLEKLNNKTVLSILDQVKVKTGDVFFLETGTIHALGAGNLIAEIQQTSDITYRVYDFDRVDAAGNKRELHIDLALEAINYNTIDARKEYKNEVNISNTIVDCPYFTTNFLRLDGTISIDKNGNSFTVYMCVEGDFEIDYENSNYHYKLGDTILIPAAMKSYFISGKASILEIYIS